MHVRQLDVVNLCALVATVLTCCNAGSVLPFMSQGTSGSAAQPAVNSNQMPGNRATPPIESQTACKRGVAYNAMTPADWRTLSPNVVWFYSWSAQAEPPAIAQDTNALHHFVPMLWGKSQLAQVSLGSLPASSFVLGFNEPNYGAQANLTPNAAAELWPSVEAIAKAQNMNIVAPAVNYCGGSCTVASPFDWLDAFLAACPNCRIDAIAVHVYMCNPNDVQSYLTQFETRYNKPLWVTEFACLDTTNPNAADELTYMAAVVAMLEADPMVHRYAWFTGRDPAQSAVDLLGADGVLTPLGQAYISLPQSCVAP